jgi:Ser/Thr protein kinase RdoA (MazF antagonist)
MPSGPSAHDEDAARSALAALGIGRVPIEPLGLGFASHAWLVRSGDPPCVLRIAADGLGESRSGEATYETEHALMERLRAIGAAVPAPIGGDWQVGGWRGPSFSLTTSVPGAPLRPEWRARAVPSLVTFIRALHGTLLPGFGPLAIVDGELRGVNDDLETGLRTWAERPLWPLGDGRLAEHPALADRPALAARLEALAGRVREALLRGPAVTLHSDLHEENTLDADGFVSVIDFGEAFVGPAAWEFASLAYFADWAFADRVLDAYLDGSDQVGSDQVGSDQVASPRRQDASLVALCFGLFRWWQDRDMDLAEDAHNEGFLEAAMARVASGE